MHEKGNEKEKAENDELKKKKYFQIKQAWENNKRKGVGWNKQIIVFKIIYI